MSSKTLMADLHDLVAAQDAARAAIVQLEARLSETIDAQEAEELAAKLNAQRTVNANLKHRIEAKQAAIHDAQRNEAKSRLAATQQERAATAAAVLATVEDARASLSAAVADNDELASTFLRANGHPWLGHTDWQWASDSLAAASEALTRLARK